MSEEGERTSNSSHSLMIIPDKLISFEFISEFLLCHIISMSTLSTTVGSNSIQID